VDAKIVYKFEDVLCQVLLSEIRKQIGWEHGIPDNVLHFSYPEARIVSIEIIP